ncbi:MAG: DUF456 domain-containing protein [Chitinophagales bacterium]|nr:DUF456 domain-containing protein [Chitinophagales bacterium]MCZ2392241.1 DUF456 domain-containing protein [Chitinophagales bacterium]
MDALIITLGIILLIIGYVSCILPPLPGPPVAYLSLVLLHITISNIKYPTYILVALGISCILVTILDNFVAIWGTHKFGGTKAGVRGSVIGMLIGIFILTPFMGFMSVIVGPILGAIVGELISGQNLQVAFKSGMGSFIGFFLGLGMKLIVTTIIAFYFFKEIF